MKKIDIKFPSKEIKLSVLIILAVILILSVYMIFSSISSGKEIISVQSGCTHRGSFNYVVVLKPNLLYGPITMNQGEKYFTNIIDYIDSLYVYELKCDNRISGKYIVSAIVKTDQWEKSYVLLNDSIIPQKDENRIKLEIRQPINFSSYLQLADSINKELGINSEKVELVLNYNIVTQENFNHDIPIPLKKDVIQINSSLIKEKKDVINKEVDKKINYYSIIPTGLLTFVLLLSIIITSRIKIKEPGTTDKIDINKVLSQHKDIIVEGMGLDGDTKNNIIQYIKSMDDLVKIADDLVKPIIHIKDYDRDIFYVLDINIRYECVIYSNI